MILPGAMLGMLGGGQLGRMFTIAARTMGYRVTVLDPDASSPAGSLADRHICADYTDREALDEMAATCLAVSTEFENVPAESLRYLAEKIIVAPSAECVAIAQDRICEKTFIASHGLPVTPFLAIKTAEDWVQDLAGYLPGILKIARLGYDGKGQIRVQTAAEVKTAFLQMDSQSCVLERLLPLATEISVIVTRSSAGVNCFPVAENQHQHGILDVTIVPARVAPEIAEKARQMAIRLAEELNYIGVLAVEFFVLTDDTLVINEIAPRPHNSGHFSLDSCVCTQFEQQVRALCGMPPGNSDLLSPVIMVNILGDIWPELGDPAWETLLAYPNVMLHLYGKQSARPGRKMGHYNILADQVDSALQQALQIKRALGQV